MALAIVLIILIIGSVAFHLWSPWYLTELASNWDTIDYTIDITFWVTGFVFVAVNAFMAWAVIRYRYSKDRRADYEPENKKLEWWLTGLTTVGVVAMLAPGLFVWGEFVQVPEDAWEMEVVGQQWHWTYRFPGEDGKLGTSKVTLITEDNPLGVNPEDPNGLDDKIIYDPVVHIPRGRPMKALLRAKDVLHNFTVPQFRVKMDLVPGLVSYVWLTPEKNGTYDILCEELCGVGHYTMRGRITVQDQADFDAWLAKQPTFAETQARGHGDPIAGQAGYAVCAACHGMQGEGNPAMNGPKLTGQSTWYLRRQIDAYKRGHRGTHPDDVYGRQMAPMVATLVNQQAVDNVVAYIRSLPDVPARPTVTGDLEHGEELYDGCVLCHGAEGMGKHATNAPRYAGMSDWYLVRQLKNFQTGVRGSHPEDKYGEQMGFMSKQLYGDESINDVVAYINSLTPGPAVTAAAR
jgi:cytochrome c oxidase subunit 2